MRTLLRPQAGFTLIEILVIAPIVILAIGAFLTVIISMTGEVLASRGSNALTYNIQDAMNRIEQDVKQSSAFLGETDITLDAANEQGWNNGATTFTNHAAGASGTSLILKMVATHGNPIDIASSIVYLANQPNACASADVQNNTPLTMNVVYFVKNNTLWRRTIMPASPSVCSTVWQQASCAPGYTAGHLCVTNDIKLVEGTSVNFFVQYFTGTSSQTPNTAASTASTTLERNTALSSTPTVAVSISATQSVAGRSIERSATLRATRLETNATAVASNIISTPSTPVVSGNLTLGENANFSWPISSGGSVTYEADYNIDGGSWTNVLSGSTNLSYSRIAVRGQTVNLRVRASNSAGTSGYGTAAVQIPLWNTVPFQNSWGNYDGAYTTFGYTKTSAGLVVLKGLVKRTGSIGAGDEEIFTLPPGFRPAGLMQMQSMTNPNISGGIAVWPDGRVTVVSLDPNYASLQDISFLSSTAGYTPTTLTPLNSWVNFGGSYANMNSTIDTAGRVNLTGLLKNGNTASAVNMAAFASGTTPPKRVYLSVRSAAGFGLIVPDNGGFLQVGVASATYTATNGKYYPPSRADGTDCTTTWCTLTLAASWVAFGNGASVYPQPGYTKGSDGLVMLRGLIKNGTTTSGTVIATLPVGYRPKARLLMQGACNSAVCRYDITPNGDVLVMAGQSASWSSLDNLYFMAEQ